MIKSLNPRRIVTAGGTLMCALGIGYFMQLSAGPAPASETETANLSSTSVVPLPASKPEEQEPLADPKPVEATEASLTVETKEFALEMEFEVEGGAEVEVENIKLTSAEPETPETAPQPSALPDTPMQMAMLGDAPIAQPPMEEPAPVFSCENTMSATSVAAAMVQLDLQAGCLADMQFTLHHNGMMISGVTDADGAWSMVVPALARDAMFIAAFENGEGAVAHVQVETLDDYDRYVVQWRGQSGLQIHAMEYGAAYGEDGHVWHDAARDMAAATAGDGGYMLRLGEGVEDTVLMAEVYTFPTRTARRDGEVSVSLEAEVNAANCGRDIEAQALMKSSGTAMTARDLTLAMPDCDAVGDFLVLKNLYEDLKIARN